MDQADLNVEMGKDREKEGMYVCRAILFYIDIDSQCGNLLQRTMHISDHIDCRIARIMRTSDHINCRITRIMHLLHHTDCKVTTIEHCTLTTCPTQIVYYSIIRPFQWSVPFSNWLSRCFNFKAHSTSKRFLKIRCTGGSFYPPLLSENFRHRIQRACSCSGRIFSIVTSLRRAPLYQ